MKHFFLVLALLCLGNSAWAEGQFVPIGGTTSGTTGSHFQSAATTNSTNVKAGAGVVYTVSATNSTATIEYLKLYDKATAPTCGTDTPTQVYPVPASTALPLTLSVPVGIGFSQGIGFCLTGASADNDTTAAAAGLVINFVWR